MKVIQLRGTNAVGKTTIVRQYIERYALTIHEETVDGRKVYITCDDSHSVIILGKYGEKWGGCDCFKDKVQVFDTIILLVKKYQPKAIIFEGLLYGKTFKFASSLNKALKRYGYSFIGIVLNADFDFVLKRLQERNGNKEINIEAFYNTWKSVLVSYDKLKKSGVPMKLVDITNYKYDEMYTILETEV